ncbi:MAG TPA: hypothetical protein VLH80_07185 [Nitrospiraceae bacterium]|nr:hypothetical protein [Nitrospiraceae bacterium]
MGKRTPEQRARKAVANENCFQELKRLGEHCGVKPVMLNIYPMHIRLFGRRRVDYWPATRRAWILGAPHGQKPVSPTEALKLAQRPGQIGLSAAATKHSSSDQHQLPLRQAESTNPITHVWCGVVPPWDESLGEYRDFTEQEKVTLADCCFARGRDG